jgi:phosphoribosylformimino-5-aminoimidazole carboxamide ribotide isomerase
MHSLQADVARFYDNKQAMFTRYSASKAANSFSVQISCYHLLAMLIIPAIDLKDGLCVRLTEGRAESARIYDGDPVEVARACQRSGASLLHVVDLDGAFRGASSDNLQVVRRIVRDLTIPIEVGGGVRSLDDITMLIADVGARHVVVGTLAVEQPETLQVALEMYGDAIVVGIDARGREVATRGWTDRTRVDAVDLARWVGAIGIERIIYTDISRDGRLEGPNFELTREIALESRVRVTASGGVADLEDITRLLELRPSGIDSVIIGKALYEGRFTLQEAIACTQQERQ